MAHDLDATQQILLDQIGGAVAILDARQPSLPTLALNLACRNLLADHTGLRDAAAWGDLFPPTDDYDIPAALRAIVASGEAREIRGVKLTRDEGALHYPGATYWDWGGQPVHGADGRVDRIIVTLVEVTAQRPGARVRQVRAGHEMENPTGGERSPGDELAAVIGALADGVLILAARGDVVEANPAGLRLLNLPSDFQGRGLHEFLRPPAVQRDDGQPFDPHNDFLGPILAGHIPADAQLLIDTGSPGQPERFISLTAVPIGGTPEANGGAVILVRDISSRKDVEREKDAFLSLISHEIKSPLTSIKGFSQLAARTIESDDDPLGRTRKHLRVIEQQTDRIGRLLGDLSDVSRLQRDRLHLDPTVFDLVPIIRATVEQQQSVLSNHRITVALPEEPLIVRADPQRIQQILEILLANAAQYSPQADRIAVTLDRRGARAALTVRDWGIGIPSEEQPRVFERFYRAPGVGGGGLGLGLFIARQIAARSDGALAVESAPGEGSTFRLDLPLAHPDSAIDD